MSGDSYFILGVFLFLSSIAIGVLGSKPKTILFACMLAVLSLTQLTIVTASPYKTFFTNEIKYNPYLPILTLSFVPLDDSTMKKWDEFFLSSEGSNYMDCGDKIVAFVDAPTVGNYKKFRACARPIYKANEKAKTLSEKEWEKKEKERVTHQVKKKFS